MKKALLIIYSLLLANIIYAQKEENVYIKNLELAKGEEEIVKATIELIDFNITQPKKEKKVNKYLHNLKSIAAKNNDSLLFGEYYFHKSRMFFGISKYDSCIVYAHKAATIFKSFNKPKKEALAKNKLGATYQILFKNKKALIYLNEANHFLKGKQLINNQIALANVYIQQNDIDRALEYYTKAYDKSIELNYPVFLYSIYSGIAAAHDKNNNPKKAIKYLQKALVEVINSNNLFLQAVSYHNIGNIYKQEGQDNEAIIFFKKGLALQSKIDNKLILGMLNIKYSETLVNLDKLKEASIYIDKADSIYRIIKNTARSPKVLYVKASIAKKEERYQDAIDLLNKSLKLSKKNEITGIISKSYFSLSETYEANGEIYNALKAYKKYESIKDSIALKKKIKEIETLNIKFDIAQYEQKLIVKNKEVALLEAKKKNSNYRNLLLGLTTLALLIFIYRQRRTNLSKRINLEQEKEIISLKKEQLETKVAYKENRITEYAVHINQRNDFLESCKTQLKAIKKSTDNKETTDMVMQLQYYIKNHIEVQKEDVEFNLESNKKTIDFKFKLEQQHPTLTDKEVMVCTYLLLNLSSKKIAEKMNITYLSVNNYRTSIRKKLELPKGGNLKRFLSNLE